MAEYKDVQAFDIAPRQKSGPKPHIDDKTYVKDHATSISDPHAFWTKVIPVLLLKARFMLTFFL